jgi:hypothetical protein
MLQIRNLIIQSQDRRHILHYNATAHPTAERTARQLLEACGADEKPRYLIRDRDAIYGEALHRRAAALQITVVPTAPDRRGRTHTLNALVVRSEEKALTK